MRRYGAAILLTVGLILNSGSIGCESDTVAWDCICEATCVQGGVISTNTIEMNSVCDEQSAAEEAVRSAVGQCDTNLAEICEDHSCSCECTPTGDSC